MTTRHTNREDRIERIVSIIWWVLVAWALAGALITWGPL